MTKLLTLLLAKTKWVGGDCVDMDRDRNDDPDGFELRKESVADRMNNETEVEIGPSDIVTPSTTQTEECGTCDEIVDKTLGEDSYYEVVRFNNHGLLWANVFCSKECLQERICHD